MRYDEDDPYLVVAADKGTGTFSDIANDVSAAYGFWLGDAFASGGSHGYDHKAMGITARGAWESVKRHFRELGTDVQSEAFTVVGIGDMSGDVFGNGMLCSEHIRLLAAFNHAHVFLDPDPDPAASFAERRRLFAVGRSSWSDYDPAVISEGGGVHARSLKSIPITPQVKEALGIEADRLSPTELIHELLRAPVDLLFNGGIGTYVKAAEETHADVGDRANDGLRVDGSELRCRVVGEGGNLGFTQRGRIDYALRGGPEQTGGRINTDAIDNVAGVNCSDHEVNIKILLEEVIAEGEMTGDERNDLLVQMTDAVGAQVLYGSYTQTQALSLAGAQAVSMLDVHARLIRRLEQVASLDREIEFLPSEKTIAARRSDRRGLVGPELATLMAYGKIFLYSELVESDLPEDPYLIRDLERYFPAPLPERFSEHIRHHRLRRELIATIVANQLVDRVGMTFAFRLAEETGARAPLLARAYAVAREVFDMRSFWDAVEALDNRIEAGTQLAMLIEGRRLVERAARWVVRAGPRAGIDVTAMADRFAAGGAGSGRRPARRPAGARSRAVRRAPGRPPGRRGAGGVGPTAWRACRRCCRCSTSWSTPAPPEWSSRWSPTSTSASARGSGSTGCATASSSCRAPIAGSPWPGPRCATTSTACTGRSRARSCSRRSSTARRSRSRTGWSATPRRWSAPTRCWPTSRARGSTTPPRCPSCCASCAASWPTPVS